MPAFRFASSTILLRTSTHFSNPICYNEKERGRGRMEEGEGGERGREEKEGEGGEREGGERGREEGVGMGRRE